MSLPSLTIVIPCYNEALAITKVIREYMRTFPGCQVVVINNASEDATEKLAREAGASVLNEPRKGKAQAMLKAFDEIHTELILMVDGDGSYPSEGAALLYDQYRLNPSDMLTGIRRALPGSPAFRPMHQWGTGIFAHFIKMLFGRKTKDVFSGLRLFSKRLYKNIPLLSRGFELEMELTIQAIDKGFTWEELEVPFREREVGTSSKLKTISDGFRILRNLVLLFRDYKPLTFFGFCSFFFLLLSLLAGFFPVYEYFTSRQIGRFPLAILAAALMNLSIFTFLTGMLSEANLRYHREAFQIRIRQFAG